MFFAVDGDSNTNFASDDTRFTNTATRATNRYDSMQSQQYTTFS